MSAIVVRRCLPLAVAGAWFGVACGLGDTRHPSEPAPIDAPVTLRVTPTEIVSEVGETFELRVEFGNVPPGTVARAGFRIADARIVSFGVVESDRMSGRCIDAGATEITVTTDPLLDTSPPLVIVRVRCEPSAASLLLIAPESLSGRHRVGVTACPQAVGTLDVRNASPQPVQVGSRAAPSALQVTPSQRSLAPGETARLAVNFDCSTRQSFDGEVVVTGSTSNGRSEEKRIPIRLTIDF